MIAAVTAKDKVDYYIDAILSGAIPSGKYIKLAINRHVNDLARQDTQEFPYYFDEAAAFKACDFFPALIKHSVGEWCGRPFELEPWQAFCNWSLFGWMRTDGTRRFRKYIKLVARKNGKSTELAGLAHYMAIADGEPGAQILTTATKIDQAKMVFRECELMRSKSPALAKHSKSITNLISYGINDSYIKPLGADKPFSGLNPHLVIFDEMHEWVSRHQKFFGTMVTGSGARRQPLFAIITTEGDDQSVIWQSELEYAQKVLDGIIEDEQLFAMLYMLDKEDQWDDESCWIKANPNLGVSAKIEPMRQMCKQARHMPMTKNDFLRFHLNRRVSSTSKAIEPEVWARAKKPFTSLEQADCICGAADIGGRDDLGSAGFCARFIDDEKYNEETGETEYVYHYEIWQKAFMSVDTKRNLQELPWAKWLYDGTLERSEFVISDIEKYIFDQNAAETIDALAFDPHNCLKTIEDFQKSGFSVVEFRQSYIMYNEPLKDFLDLLAKDRIRHNGDEVLSWAVNNLSIKKDGEDRWMPCKKTSSDKIDPIVSCLMAFRLAKLQPPRQKSLFIG